MSKKIIRFSIPLIALFFIGYGVLSAFLIQKEDIKTLPNDEKINLALRQTAHWLLQQAGDSVSRIAPITKTNKNTFLARIEHHFNYDSLPIFLNKSFENHQITGDYDVSVWDCSQKELILGYRSIDFFRDGNVPCGGRNQTNECYNFTVTFNNKALKLSNFNLNTLIGGFLIALGTAGLFFYWKSLKNKNTEIISPTTEGGYDENLIYVGNSVFDSNNQLFTTGNNQAKLTFREAKLLQLFCNHKNELLDRDYILKHVWEDEGVLVGRSVDVFVSRLRKIIKDDATLKITNVHARGYRFEVI